ncbi:MAG: hypothetical protein GVY11_01885 [Gammaproteobacteria bacterium]|jgi:hypothetical protein|nr:hypothetical protein [Gammaproteobacteria bacterium]
MLTAACVSGEQLRAGPSPEDSQATCGRHAVIGPWPAIDVPPGRERCEATGWSAASLQRKFIASLSASEALAAMNEDLFTSEEYVDILVDRIQGNPDINAFVHLQPDAARQAARQADRVRDAG